MSFLAKIALALRGGSRKLAVLALTVWIATIWYFSSQSPPDHVGTSSFARSWAMNLRHAPAFGMLGVLFLWATSRVDERLVANGRRVGWALAAVVAYGCIDERHQFYVVGRDASASDVLTDLAGGWLAVALLRAVEDGAPRTALVRILAIGVPACVLAAYVATLVSRQWPGITWL